MQTLAFTAMNTAVLLAAEGPDDIEPALLRTQALIQGLEQRLSRFLPDSELTRLNRSAGAWHSVSPDLLELLVLASQFSHETGGLFDPAILPALERAGYDRSMTEIRTHGAGRSDAAVPIRMSIQEMQLDPLNLRARLPRGLQLDLGGIAKGWIVDRAASLLYSKSAACAVSAGGDIVFHGYPSETPGWQVAIEDPRDPENALAYLQLEPGAVATSSVTRRTWKQGQATRHHIIDPRTQQPAVVDALSVTVVAPQITVAEVYAKALLICAEGERAPLAASRPDLTYFVAWPGGTVTTTGTELYSGLALELAA
jgi:thiamine biosynthesis lipoprotein